MKKFGIFYMLMFSSSPDLNSHLQFAVQCQFGANFSIRMQIHGFPIDYVYVFYWRY